MLRPEFDPDECVACGTCTACRLGIHSCCHTVVCATTHRLHACDCHTPEHAPAHDEGKPNDRR